MVRVKSILGCGLVSCGLFWRAVCPTTGENLYHWKDEAGTSYYSNVAPPVESTEYSVFNRPDRKVNTNASPSLDDSSERMTSATGSDSIMDSYFDSLARRIRDRESSIRYMEALLKERPDDSGLREKLLRKRQRLFMDLTALEEHGE